MRFLIYGINFYPELTGIGKYTYEMCEWLVKRGHEVDVITGMPYYPKWHIFDNYKGRFWFKEKINGITVYRTPIYVPEKATGFKRILQEISFFVNSFWLWLGALRKKYDVVFAVCPPLIAGIHPYWFTKIKKSLFVFHIQDLQVDMARGLGIIKNKFILDIVESVERFLFKNADILSTISEGMAEVIKKNKCDRDVLLLPNWVDVEFISPKGRDNKLRKDLGFRNEDKIILYSGNIGRKQGLSMVLDAAKNFKDREDVWFLFVGEGVGKAELEKKKEDLQLRNVRFLPLQPYDRLAELLSLADLHLVIQKKAASDLVMPSKLTGILAVGGLSVITAPDNSYLKKVVEENKMGIVIEPEDKKALEIVINEILSGRMDVDLYRRNAREYARGNLSIDYVLSAFEKALAM